MSPTADARSSSPESPRAERNHVTGKWAILPGRCPFNSARFVKITRERDYRSDWREAHDRSDVPEDLPGTQTTSLVELIRMTREEWDVWTRGSAVRRAGYAGFKRNVGVAALGNWGSEAAVPVLTEALKDDEPLVRGHPAWALGRIGSTAARDALEDAIEQERDVHVLHELVASLG